MGDNNFDGLVGRIESVTNVLQEDAKAVVNRNVTARAWLTGFYIVEYEQHGRDRAKYGDGLLKALAKRLNGDSFALSSLKNYRLFYLTYPELAIEITGYLVSRFGKGQSVIGFSGTSGAAKGQSAIGFLDEVVTAVTGQSMTVFTGRSVLHKGEAPIVQSEAAGGMVVESSGNLKISSWYLFNRLSFTHILQLLPLHDELQRTFYAFEAIRGTWSVKELRRQIASQYYVRSGWSTNPSKLSALTLEKADKDTLRETLRSPHVFEFLGLAGKDVWEESDLEQGIIDHLQEFILEMGLGFCFEARQKKILIDDQYYKVDLVFYHRILKCHVLVELKPRNFDYADAAQLGVYLAYYRKNVCRPDDNPPVGILLCTEAGREMAEYVSTFIDPALFVSKYELELPPKERIVEFLRKENKTEASN